MNEPIARQDFTTISTAVLLNRSFLALRYPVRLVYLYMVIMSRGAKGFTFTPKVYESLGFSKRTIGLAVRELIASGFITKERDGFFKENLYTFSDAWQKKN